MSTRPSRQCRPPARYKSNSGDSETATCAPRAADDSEPCDEALASPGSDHEPDLATQEESSPAPRPTGKGRRGAKRKRSSYEEGELEELAENHSSKLEKTTYTNYKSHFKKIEAFFEVHKDIAPLSECNTPEEAVAVCGRVIKWVGNGMEGFDYSQKRDEMTFGLVKMVRSALVYKYDQLCLERSWEYARGLGEFLSFKNQFAKVKSLVLPKKGRPKGDPQDNTSASSLTKAEVEACADHWFKDGSLASTRDASLNLLDAHCAGRGDDGREIYLPDICPPVPFAQIGPCACLMFPIVLRGGKATQVWGMTLLCG